MFKYGKKDTPDIHPAAKKRSKIFIYDNKTLHDAT